MASTDMRPRKDTEAHEDLDRGLEGRHIGLIVLGKSARERVRHDVEDFRLGFTSYEYCFEAGDEG